MDGFDTSFFFAFKAGQDRAVLTGQFVQGTEKSSPTVAPDPDLGHLDGQSLSDVREDRLQIKFGATLEKREIFGAFFNSLTCK
jgi:hypothetical protein